MKDVEQSATAWCFKVLVTIHQNGLCHNAYNTASTSSVLATSTLCTGEAVAMLI